MLLVEDTSSFGKAEIRGLVVFIAERWIDSVVDVVRVNEQMIMYVKLAIRKQILNIVAVYAPQVGLSAEEKYEFWDYLMVTITDRCLVKNVKVI